MKPEELGCAVAEFIGVCIGGVIVLYAILYFIMRMGWRLPWWPKDVRPVRSLKDFFEGF